MGKAGFVQCADIYNDPDVSFEELPDDWICPICGMPKSISKKIIKNNGVKHTVVYFTNLSYL
ncbi:MAG: rubredoxin [Acutalibacteraceae bacterium]